MINSKHFGVEFLIVLILTKASTSQETPCNWKLDVDCWLYCTDDGSSADVIHSIEEKWNEVHSLTTNYHLANYFLNIKFRDLNARREEFL